METVQKPFFMFREKNLLVMDASATTSKAISSLMCLIFRSVYGGLNPQKTLFDDRPMSMLLERDFSKKKRDHHARQEKRERGLPRATALR